MVHLKRRGYGRALGWLGSCVLLALAGGSAGGLGASSGTALTPEERVAGAVDGQVLMAVTTGYYQVVAFHSGKCLDVAGVSHDDGAVLLQWDCHTGDDQQWLFEPIDGGYFRITVRHSAKALDIAGASPDDGAAAIQSTPLGGASQQWSLQPQAGGYYSIAARHSGKVLEVAGGSQVSGASFVQNTWNGGASQHFLLRPVTPPPPPPPPPVDPPPPPPVDPPPPPPPVDPPPVDPPPPPPPPPPPVDPGPSSADVVRFLEQATFGPTTDLVAHVKAVGFEAYLNEQFNAPMSSYPTMQLYPTTRDEATCPAASTCPRDNYSMYPLQNRFFFNALYGPDQLRQRVAFALHQIIVVSGADITQPSWMSPYLQTLDRNALGNFRQLLYEISLNPAMGNYLDINNNTKNNPNENYAREILQLFSLGTYRLNPDGTQQVDGTGQAIPTYTQTTVNSFARVFTGWRLATAPAPGVPNYIDPMVANEVQHDVAAKALLNGVVLPAAQNAAKDLNDAIDNIFNDPNVGPFISKQLIQHLVTSNPSPAYVARVVSAFNGEVSGARGDMKAVVRAILLDPEARGDVKTDPNYGHQRHPALFISNILRAFSAKSASLSGESDGYLNPQSSAMGMDVFRPPSVFSYFSPGAGVPGTAGVRGPEFGVFSTSTSLRRVNFVNTMVFATIAVGANSPNGTALDLAPLQALAATPDQLVDKLNELLLHGTMSPTMRASVISAVSAVSASNALKRARTAVYLVATSSQYQVER